MGKSPPAPRGRSSFTSRLREWARPCAGVALSSLLAGGVAGAIVLTGKPAVADTAYESAYGFDRTWNAALRMVRVDMACKITEKDDQSGYLMFEYHSSDSGKKVSSGSMEFIRPREKDGSVRIVIQLPQMPRYHEQVMLDALVRKMRAEYGDAPQRQPPPRPSPAPSMPSAPPAQLPDAGNAPEAGEGF